MIRRFFILDLNKIRTYLKVNLLLTFTLLSYSQITKAQSVESLNSAQIQQGLKKLKTAGSALYIAAHPDDENTAMLAWLANEKNMRTGYLSLTRGDGGQNLIGSEQAELMGLIRTHELLAARKKDGAEQFFTRANDFGFSKSPEEAFQIWGKEEILSDVVWTIRKFKPDVIITRFPATGEGGHGHHTASAILAEEAFKAAADPKRFPEQLKWVQPWQAKRLLWNTWSAEGKQNVIKVNLGTYNTVFGKSYNEIAAESRSMHKSQGFGAGKNRGDRIDNLVHIAGEIAKEDLFEGINSDWSRIKGSEKVADFIQQAYSQYKAESPEKTVPYLISAYKELMKVDNAYWREVKGEELKKLILACTGTWFEAIAEKQSVNPGETIKVTANIVSRTGFPVQIKQVKFMEKDTVLNTSLASNQLLSFSKAIIIPVNTSYSHPYWLREKHPIGLFTVSDRKELGIPVNIPSTQTEFVFTIQDLALSFTIPFEYKRTDPVEGEIYRLVDIVPEATATLSEKVYMFPDGFAKPVSVIIRAGKTDVQGVAKLNLPKNWRAEPSSIPFNLEKKGEELKVTFMVYPTKLPSQAQLSAQLDLKNGKKINQGFIEIKYPHLPILSLFPEAEAKMVRLDIAAKGKIAYIIGAGDEVPSGLRQIGYDVHLLSESRLDTVNFQHYTAVIAGVRAYNTVYKLNYIHKRIMDYVNNGGTYIVQYNVARGLVTEPIGPYPIKLSSDRITEEKSTLKILDTDHTLFNFPNKITPSDFDGWVQERGLYFANSWDSNYVPLLAGNDKGEQEKSGMLLYAKYGKGTYIYTGLSFFRQLPAGVPGAYRLLNNLISTSEKNKRINP